MKKNGSRTECKQFVSETVSHGGHGDHGEKRVFELPRTPCSPCEPFPCPSLGTSFPPRPDGRGYRNPGLSPGLRVRIMPRSCFLFPSSFGALPRYDEVSSQPVAECFGGFPWCHGPRLSVLRKLRQLPDYRGWAREQRLRPHRRRGPFDGRSD